MTEPVGSSRGMRPLPAIGPPEGVAAKGSGPRRRRSVDRDHPFRARLRGFGYFRRLGRLSDGLVGVALVVMTASGAVYLIGSIVG